MKICHCTPWYTIISSWRVTCHTTDIHFMQPLCNQFLTSHTISVSRAPSQYPKRRLSVRFRKVSKPRYLYLELSDRYEIWQAPRQQCCRCACQISKRYGNLKYQSHGFETLRDLMERRLFGYWDGARVLTSFHAFACLSGCPFVCPSQPNHQSLRISDIGITLRVSRTRSSFDMAMLGHFRI